MRDDEGALPALMAAGTPRGCTMENRASTDMVTTSRSRFRCQETAPLLAPVLMVGISACAASRPADAPALLALAETPCAQALWRPDLRGPNQPYAGQGCKLHRGGGGQLPGLPNRAIGPAPTWTAFCPCMPHLMITPPAPPRTGPPGRTATVSPSAARWREVPLSLRSTSRNTSLQVFCKRDRAAGADPEMFRSEHSHSELIQHAGEHAHR